MSSPECSGREGPVRLDLLDKAEIPNGARLLVSTESGYLPRPRDACELIVPCQQGRAIAVANTSSKATCKLKLGGLTCHFFFAPNHNEVFLDLRTRRQLPDLVCINSPPEEAGQEWKSVDTSQTKFTLTPGVWRVFWLDRDQRERRISADILVTYRTYELHLPLSNRPRNAEPWNNPLLSLGVGETFSIRSPTSQRFPPSEDYSMTCHEKIHDSHESAVFVTPRRRRQDQYAVKLIKLNWNSYHPTETVHLGIKAWVKEVQMMCHLSHVSHPPT